MGGRVDAAVCLSGFVLATVALVAAQDCRDNTNQILAELAGGGGGGGGQSIYLENLAAPPSQSDERLYVVNGDLLYSGEATSDVLPGDPGGACAVHRGRWQDRNHGGESGAARGAGTALHGGVSHDCTPLRSCPQCVHRRHCYKAISWPVL